MDKRTFIKELRRKLESLPFEEREDAVSYYEEYLEEAGPEGEAEAIKNFGTVEEVAARIMGEKQRKTTSPPPEYTASPKKQGMSSTTKIILIIVTLPLTIPLASSVLGVLLGVFGTILGFGLAGIGMIGGGLFTLVSSFWVATSSAPTFIFFLGTALVVLALGVLLFVVAYQLAVFLPRAIIRLCRSGWEMIKGEAN